MTGGSATGNCKTLYRRTLTDLIHQIPLTALLQNFRYNLQGSPVVTLKSTGAVYTVNRFASAELLSDS